jgi:hypothetical protein
LPPIGLAALSIVGGVRVERAIAAGSESESAT